MERARTSGYIMGRTEGKRGATVEQPRDIIGAFLIHVWLQATILHSPSVASSWLLHQFPDLRQRFHNRYTEHLSEHELEAEAPVKLGDKTEDTLRINRGAIRRPSPNPSLISIDESNNIRLGRNPDYDPVYHDIHASRSPGPPRTHKGRLQTFWKSNKGLALVLISQLFGTLMNVTTRMLEMEGNDGRPLH
jgi:hypothetical protein